MAGTVTHLVIADRLAGEWGLSDIPLFFCGNLAPDAIMARDNYVRQMKKHTHFRDDIPTDDFHLEENFLLYQKRFDEFKRRFLYKGNPEYDLYLGYVVHILCDEYFVLNVRDKHVERLKADNYDYRKEGYFKQFGLDVDSNDLRLVEEYPFRYPMPQTIETKKNYEIKDYITSDEIEKSKKYIIDKNFYSNQKHSDTVVFSYEENLSYIEGAIDYVLKKKKEGFFEV